MALLVTRVNTELVAQLDEMVESGETKSRSEAVRSALEAMLDQRRRWLIGEAIVDGYRRIPETEEELRWAERNLRDMTAEEPWEQW